jgi:diguanylate cyclase (GGDEF)-like protein/PAS domain S-box-containing protein
MNNGRPWALRNDPQHPAGLVAWVLHADRAPWRWAIGLSLLLLIGQTLPAAKFFTTPANYLPLHTGLEFISIAVSVMVFALAWNLRRQANNSHLMLLGTGFLAVSMIDFAHTLSYAGMPDWVTPSGAEKAINFWLAGRLMAALVLLAVARQGVSHWPEARCRSALQAALLGAAGVVWLGLYQDNLWPHTFVPGQGLTAFKIGTEYLLMGLYGLAAVLLYVKSQRTGNRDMQWLAASAWVQGLAEMFFTLYVDVTDLFNLLGHVYKAMAYLMVYRALFSAGVQSPFQKLQASQDLTQGMLQTTLDGFLRIDRQGNLLEVNPTYCQQSGFSRDELLLMNITQLEAQETPDQVQQHMARLIHNGYDLFETHHRRKDGTQWPLEVSASYSAQSPTEGQFLMFIRDITERTRIEDQVRQLAFHDALTQLPNRRLLTDRMQQAMAASQRSARFGAVMLLDLDNFKPLNDEHGHGAGDLLLKEVARRLLACVRASDTVARVGGDEFVVLINELNTDLAASKTQACAVAEKIRLSLAEPYRLANPNAPAAQSTLTHRCTASIGLVLFTNHEAQQEDLLKWADAAMYEAKNAGRNAIHYHPSDKENP